MAPRPRLTSTSVGTASWSRNRWSRDQRPPPSSSQGTPISRLTSSQRLGAACDAGVRTQPLTFTRSAGDPSPTDLATGFLCTIDW